MPVLESIYVGTSTDFRFGWWSVATAIEGKGVWKSMGGPLLCMHNPRLSALIGMEEGARLLT